MEMNPNSVQEQPAPNPIPAPAPPATAEASLQAPEPQPAEAQPAEALPTETQPAEERPAEPLPTETQPAEAQPAEPLPTEAQPAEVLPTEAPEPASGSETVSVSASRSACASAPVSETLSVSAPAPAPGPEYPCDPERTARIAQVLRELLDPAFVLLFGKMAGQTPHSDTYAYDLLAVTDGQPRYDWYRAKRYLKMKIPWVGHGAPHINLYVHSRHDVETNPGPFIYLVRKEGSVLYSSRRQKFPRPKSRFDFGRAAADAANYAQMFLAQADRLVGYARLRTEREHGREAAFALGQAAVYYYRTLFFVYHGFDADTCDTHRLHHRLRTLSGELPLIFEGDEFQSVSTLRLLKKFAEEIRYDPDFSIGPEELGPIFDPVRRLGETVAALCGKRIALYEKRAR